MASFIDFNLQDANKKPGRMRVPVTAAAIPTGYDTYASAVAAAAFGSGLMSLVGVLSASLVIDLGLTPITTQPASEIRNKWQATMLNGGEPIMRFSVPGSNPSFTLIVNGSQIVADLSKSAFTSVLAALVDTSGGVHMIEPDEGTVVQDWGPVLAQTRARKRPRVGGSR